MLPPNENAAIGCVRAVDRTNLADPIDNTLGSNAARAVMAPVGCNQHLLGLAENGMATQQVGGEPSRDRLCDQLREGEPTVGQDRGRADQQTERIPLSANGELDLRQANRSFARAHRTSDRTQAQIGDQN